VVADSHSADPAPFCDLCLAVASCYQLGVFLVNPSFFCPKTFSFVSLCWLVCYFGLSERYHPVLGSTNSFGVVSG
jgi:hypothetical protein